VPKKDNQQSLSDALRSFIDDHDLKGGLNQVRAAEAWSEVMGPGVANYTRKVRLQGSTLIVSLDSSVLREELSLGSSRIREMMNEALGGELIEKIRLQ
jgi:predicted nucleic acid-binding Zn ribbon protein